MADGSALIFTWSYFFATQSVMLNVVNNFEQERLNISMAYKENTDSPIPDIRNQSNEGPFKYFEPEYLIGEEIKSAIWI